MLGIFVALLSTVVLADPRHEHSDPKDSLRTSHLPPEKIFSVNEELVVAVNKLYNKAPHHYLDHFDVEKVNFALVAQFFVKFLELYNLNQGVPLQYKRAYDDALVDLDQNQNSDPAVTAARFVRFVNFLRIVIAQRVADVQRLCANVPGNDCRVSVNKADQQNRLRCPGYPAHVAVHEKLLFNCYLDKLVIKKVVDTAFLDRVQVKTFLETNRHLFQAALVRLADVYHDLTNVRYECTKLSTFNV